MWRLYAFECIIKIASHQSDRSILKDASRDFCFLDEKGDAVSTAPLRGGVSVLLVFTFMVLASK
jgi:hypothetical protein